MPKFFSITIILLFMISGCFKIGHDELFVLDKKMSFSIYKEKYPSGIYSNKEYEDISYDKNDYTIIIEYTDDEKIKLYVALKSENLESLLAYIIIPFFYISDATYKGTPVYLAEIEVFFGIELEALMPFSLLGDRTIGVFDMDAETTLSSREDMPQEIAAALVRRHTLKWVGPLESVTSSEASAD